MSLCQFPMCKHSVPINTHCEKCLEDKAESYHDFSTEVMDIRLDILFNRVEKLSSEIKSIKIILSSITQCDIQWENNNGNNKI